MAEGAVAAHLLDANFQVNVLGKDYNVSAQVREPPTVNFRDHLVHTNGSASLNFTDSSGKGFGVSVVGSADTALAFTDMGSSIAGSIEDFSLDNVVFLYNTLKIPLGIAKTVFMAAWKLVIQPLLNKKLAAGFPLPAIAGIKLTQGRVDFVDSWATGSYSLAQPSASKRTGIKIVETVE